MERIRSAWDQVDLSMGRPKLAAGQGLAEYALILALIAIVAILSLLFLGGNISDILSNVGNSI
jgi:Flp pilus assembly pilin Flp